MKLLSLFLLLLVASRPAYSQKNSDEFDSKKFFNDESILEATITAEMGPLFNNKNKTTDVKGTFSILFPDSSVVSDEVAIRPRGNFRLENCIIPPLKMDFKKESPTKLSPLKSLKLVNGCSTGSYNDQLTLKEYLVYKIYNLLTEKSFRVRLLNLKIEDSKKRKKTIALHSFFIEDLDDLAKRNQCKKWDDAKTVNTEGTNRAYMTFVSIFQYMIGNTDWAVPVGHNIRLMSPKNDSLARPFAIPYDFDYAGLVDANYALPDEQLGTQSVRERVYRGFPRTIEELKTAMQVFTDKKEAIYSLIKNFDLLTSRNRADMISYLDGFYNSIKSDNDLKILFIDHARSQ
ncbi:MAG: hypothetical protein JST09_07725 [Bacteroidetes bacterium]|nr:hypothetical protein [Bacteroidota bacterium]